MPYRSPRDWLDECQQLPAHDMDNVILYTGPERMGKSSLAIQHLHYLDPTFSIDDICGGIQDFIHRLKTRPGKGGAILADEIRAHRRAAMRGDTIQLIETLTECGGLNRHLALCYPHEALFEGFLLDHRIRWKCHIPGPEELGLPPTVRPGVFQLYQRSIRRWHDAQTGQETAYVTWIERGRWKFNPTQGPLWDQYQQRKEERMRAHLTPTQGPAYSRFAWYPDALTSARTLLPRRRQDPHQGPSPADIRTNPQP
ncbi:MAG: hypothetical protein ACYDDF_11530 [Thermoplasmatota archaeon]